MGRKRETDKGLPEGIYLKHGSYHYRNPVTKKWKKIGNSYHEMLRNYLKLIDNKLAIYRTMNDLFDRYMLEIAPFKAVKTYKDQLKQMIYLRGIFGGMSPGSIKPIHVYKYLDERGKKSRWCANREKALLSHVFTMAIRWGAVELNPCTDVRSFTEKPRDRYVTNEEFSAVRSLADPYMQYIMDFAFITGLRRSDILKVQLSDLTEQGIVTTHQKTKKRYLIQWNDDLMSLVHKIRQLDRSKISLFLFCTKEGDPYTPDGFSSLWQRLMKKALAANIIKESFRFHDIRRKAATEAENFHGIEHARKLLGHTTQGMTERYISGTRSVIPLTKLSNMQ